MQFKPFFSFALLLFAGFYTPAQVYETMEEVTQKYVGLETYQYASYQPRKGFGVLTYSFDLVVSDSLQFRRRKAIYFEEFKGHQICYRWEVRVETDAEMKFYQSDFDKKFTKSRWRAWEKEYMIGDIYYMIQKQDYGYLISAHTEHSLNQEYAKGNIKWITPSSPLPHEYWEEYEEESIK